MVSGIPQAVPAPTIAERGQSAAAQIISRGPVRLTIICAAVLAALVVVAAVYVLTNLRERILAENERQLANTSLILAKHVEHMFDNLEVVQKDLIDEFNKFWIGSREYFERNLTGYDAHSSLKDKNLGMPYVGSLSFFNPQGKLVNFSRQWPVPEIDVSDRDFFQAFLSEPAPDRFLGKPVLNRATGTWVMHLAKKVQSLDGKFLGVITGALELEYFHNYLKGVSLTPNSSIAVFRDDGTLLVRYPVIEPDIGKVFKNALALKLVAYTDRGVGRTEGIFDGQERIVAARRVDRYPIIIAATGDVNSLLADWQRAANFITGIAVIIILCIAGLAWGFIRSLKRHHELVRIRAEQAEAEKIREQNLRFDAALNNMSQGLLMFDSSARLVVCNSQYLQMYGLAPESVRPGISLFDLIRLREQSGSFVGDPEEYCSNILAAVGKEEVTSFSLETPDGRIFRVVTRPMEGGGWVATHEDITDRTRAEKERDRNQKFLDLVIDNVPATIVVKDARDFRYVLINRAGEEYYGLPRSEMIGRTAYEVLPKISADLVTALDRQLLEAYSAPIVNEHTIETSGGDTRTSIATRLPILDEKGEPQYLLAVVNDITEQRRAEARIVHMAHHDALTDLPNRVLLREILERELSHAQRGRRLAVHYLDLDHFKSVNDTLGHTVGDELIKAVTTRMRKCLRKSDTIARFGGDEFVIVQTEVERPLDAADLAQAVRAAVANMPFEVSGHQVVIDVSAGISLAPEDSCDPDELLKYADMALYGAKSDGRGTYRFFEPKLDARMKSRRSLEVDLRKALGKGEFELHYQPLVSIGSGKINGFEALLRWRHPERGLIPPAEFIPTAEEIGLISSLGDWVLREACAEAARWPEPLRVAVNISPVHFIGQNLLHTVVGSLATSGLPANRLELEVTEAVLLQSTERTLNTMRQLRELGVRIAMDDFGTGYSSLSYLRNFPFNKIKIDRDFIRDIARQESARSIVRAVIALGASLGMTTTAEGVETEEQLKILRAEGCTEMQGYLFSPARPAAEIERLFLRRTRRRSVTAA